MRQLRTWSLESQRTGVQTPAWTFSTLWSKASQSFNVLDGMELGTVSISWESYSEDQMHVKQHRACEHSLNVITIRNRVSYYKNVHLSRLNSNTSSSVNTERVSHSLLRTPALPNVCFLLMLTTPHLSISMSWTWGWLWTLAEGGICDCGELSLAVSDWRDVN